MVGTLDVEGMLASISPEQMAGWEAYDSIEPLGTKGVRELLAVLCGLESGQSGNDFLPPWERRVPREQTPEEQRDALKRAAGAAAMCER